jgi:hypothetical protein
MEPQAKHYLVLVCICGFWTIAALIFFTGGSLTAHGFTKMGMILIAFVGGLIWLWQESVELGRLAALYCIAFTGGLVFAIDILPYLSSPLSKELSPGYLMLGILWFLGYIVYKYTGD